MKTFGRLFRPLDYLRIHHPQKAVYDYVIPICVSLPLTILITSLPVSVKVFGENSLISSITGILQILTGFYIASLAAVATFNKDGMDDPLAGRPVMLKTQIKGKTVDEKVTRRRFLCLLFGYLALLSIFLYFIGTGANLFHPNAVAIFSAHCKSYLRFTYIFVYLFCTANLVVTTLHGLYYMVDRIHRSDSKRVESP